MLVFRSEGRPMGWTTIPWKNIYIQIYVYSNNHLQQFFLQDTTILCLFDCIVLLVGNWKLQ